MYFTHLFEVIAIFPLYRKNKLSTGH